MNDRFRFSVHAVVTDDEATKVLLLRASYADRAWGLPGGAVEPGETITDALLREGREELGCTLQIVALTGWYYHSSVQAQVGIFRCELPPDAAIRLSPEHTELNWIPIAALSGAQAIRIGAAVAFTGELHTATF